MNAEFTEPDNATAVTYALAPCSLGVAIIAAAGGKLCALWFGDAREPLVKSVLARFPRAREAPDDAALAALVAKAVALIERPHLPWGGRLALAGTPFQLEVWEALQEVPPGKTASYAEIARRIGRPEAVRAVAGAIAANPIAVAVPCHRIIHSDGSLGGYAAGAERKRILLQRESAALKNAAA
jgi:AraC family transcriptional regulator, regulatory protein of adaptative response / methylated-DNA-[protein]-cysteine methyltransferase